MDSIELINIIKKMLAKGLTSAERQKLVNEKPMVNYHLRQWEKAPKAHLEDHVESRNILDKVIARCRNEQQLLLRKKKNYRIGYSIAAAALIFIIGYWIVINFMPSYINVSAPLNDKLAVMLPDSSEVWLNAASQIRYRKSFRKNREIYLEKGEAFFKVKKAQGAPFKIYFHESMIQVTGTEFNVKCNNAESEIILFSGAITFESEKGQERLLMKPSERIVYNANVKSIVRTNIDTNEYDWRSNKLRFTNKPLHEFIEYVNRSYLVNIIIKDKKKKELKFNGTIYKDESLADILDKICISLDLKKKQENNMIILY